MATVTLSASEFQDRVGEALDRSLSQPVLITKHGRPRNVVLSYDEYERLRARDRRAVRAEDLTDEDIAALEASEMGPGYEHLDAELQAK
jgi:prevent-host-death family protein